MSNNRANELFDRLRSWYDNHDILGTLVLVSFIVVIVFIVVFGVLLLSGIFEEDETWHQHDRRLVEAGCIPLAYNNHGHITLWNKECPE